MGLGTRALSLDDSPPRMHSYGSSTQNQDPDPQPPRNSILYRDKTCSADEVTHSKLHRRSDSDPARTQTPFLFSPLSGPHVCMSSSFHKAEIENPVPSHVRYVLRNENIKRSRGKTKPTRDEKWTKKWTKKMDQNETFQVRKFVCITNRSLEKKFFPAR